METAQVPNAQAVPTKRRRRKRDKHFKPNFEIPGVHKLVLNDATQATIGCIVGENVTAERPWTEVDTDIIQSDLDMHAESSEFLPIKEEVMKFPGPQILVGYIPDQSKDEDEFYICVTEEAIQKVNELKEKARKIQEDKLNNAMNRKIKHWKSLGSENEIEKSWIRYNRPLIEVEVESKYPILPNAVHFRHTKTQEMKDGYMEIRSSEDAAGNLYKRRNNIFIQVSPEVVSKNVQTLFVFPKNSYTQYEYSITDMASMSEQCEQRFQKYVSKDLENLCDILRINNSINIYTNDYEKLILHPNSIVRIEVSELKEYLCFIDMEICGNKMISSLCFHQMWSGCAIVSYVEIAPTLYLESKITTDEVLKAVHDTNPVLFWSFDDDLKPKLILETPRPVYVLSSCPFDPNLIVGGMVNGQIIIWDITNKLSRVEEEEVLTVEQQSYRTYMASLMTWMINIFSLAKVRPTVVSDLKYSHTGCVNAISWMSPHHRVSKNGKIEEMGDEVRSLQFLTSSEDGTVMIWDLLNKPKFVSGGFKSDRRMRRLKKRPSALLDSESPFKPLHLNLKPIYKLNLVDIFENRLLNISAFFAVYHQTTYEVISKESKKTKLSDRIIYEPVFNMDEHCTEKKFCIGTMEGDFIEAKWDGQEFDSGEVVNYEDCQFISRGRYHDGPIVSIDYSVGTDTILSVGGKVFALWRRNFPGRPVLWRKTISIYTSGGFFAFVGAYLKFVRIDGYSELWTIFHKSKYPVREILTSNGAVTNILAHVRKIKSSVPAFCDYRGLLRMYSHAHISPTVTQIEEKSMNDFLTQETERKRAFLKWQEEWNERHTSKLEPVKTEDHKKTDEEEDSKVITKTHEKKKLSKTGLSQRYLEVVQEQHRVSEQARMQRMKSIILQKKQMNTGELEKQREPLKNIEEENEMKKQKQKSRVRESDKIFKNTVAMLFPEVNYQKPPPPPDPYQDCYEETLKQRVYRDYQKIAIIAQDYIDDNPFSLEFNYGAVLKQGQERRRQLHKSYNSPTGHRRRYENVKIKRAEEEAVTVVSEKVTVGSFHSTHTETSG